MSIKVFVYGTLKPGEINYQRYCEGKVLAAQPAIAFGQLFNLSIGYPAMIPGHSPVQGFLLTFTDSTVLTNLDELEDYNPQRRPEDNEYCRRQVMVYNLQRQALGQAWIYLMQPERVQRLGGKLIASGYWNSRNYDQ